MIPNHKKMSQSSFKSCQNILQPSGKEVFLCTLCTKSFPYSSQKNLEAHVTMKHSQGKLICLHCNLSLSTRRNLDKHIRNGVCSRKRRNVENAGYREIAPAEVNRTHEQQSLDQGSNTSEASSQDAEAPLTDEEYEMYLWLIGL